MGIGDPVKLPSSTRIDVGDALNSLELMLPTDWFLLATSGTYISASSFSVAGDYTAYLIKGTKFKLTNSGIKYGHVVSSSFGSGITTVVIAVNNDYTIANAAISNIYFSYRSPADFPTIFLYTPTIVGFSALPSPAKYMYSCNNGFCTLVARPSATGTSNSTSYTISLPFTAKASMAQIVIPCSYAYDNGTLKTQGVATVEQGATTAILYPDQTGAGWTNSGNKTSVFGPLDYPI
jgi:hypothetical protein